MGELYNPFPKLPKNIRQIGERDQSVRLYLEDYVNTYLKRLYPKGGQDLRVGVLLGTAEEREGTPYLFVDGAMEMEDVTENGEKVNFTEVAWKKMYQAMEQMFPKRVILGWFLCGAPGSTLSPLNYWKQHGQYFAGKNQLMYLNCGLDGEEAVYVAAEEGFYKLRGYSIYYERNQMMQDYMILRKDVRRVESGTGDTVIRDFRQRMDDTKQQVTYRKNTIRVLSGLCTALGILVLAGGVTILSNYEQMREMEAVLASVLPAGVRYEDEVDRLRESLSDDGYSHVIVEEAAGQLQLTVAAGQDGNDSENGSGNGNPESNGSAEPGTDEDNDNGIGALTSVSGENQPPGGNATAGAPDSASTGETAAASSDSNVDSDDPDVSTVSAGQNVEAGQTIYEVQRGDTLYGICLDFYGNGSKMQEICELNGLDNENTIVAGQNLILP